TPAQRVQDVVRVLCPKTAQHNPLALGPAGVLCIRKVHEIGAVGDVGTAVAWIDAGGDEESVGEHGRLVGAALALAVFEDNNLVVRLLPRLDLWIDLAGGDPQTARGIKIHLNRLGQEGIGGEEIHFEPVSDLKRPAFNLGIGIGNGSEVALPVYCSGVGD